MYREHFARLAARVETEVADRLALGPAEAARRAQRLMDEAQRLSEARSSEPRPACAAGCSFCCHVHVEATLPELQAIVSFLKATRTAPDLATLQQKLAEHVVTVDSLSDEARWAARIPCALLDAAGHCSVYSVRPLRCRAFHSCSLEACRAAFDGASPEPPPLNASIARTAAAVESGYDRALAAARQSASVRLERGLLEVMAGVESARPDDKRPETD